VTTHYYPTAPPANMEDRLGQLSHTLEALGDQLCLGIAQAVAQAASGAVREYLFALLAGRRNQPLPPPRPPYAHRPSSAWDDRNDSWESWGREAGYHSWHGESHDPWAEGEDDEPYVPASQPVAEAKARPRWVTALAASWQASRLWLRLRPVTRRPLLTALIVGVFAGLGTFACGAVAAAALTVVGTALGLVALARLARNATDSLAAP
jgi:hypothetical protein